MAYVYRSITLAEGESYVLPAGAELVGVDGTIIDEGGCANTDNVETIACYMAAIGAFSDPGNSSYGETVDGDTRPLVAKGIYQNGIYTPFTTGDFQGLPSGDNVGCFDAITLANKIKELIPGIIDVNGTGLLGVSGSVNNCLTFVLIQTVPSLAENLYIWMAHSVTLDGGNPGGTDFIIPFKTFAYWSSIPDLTGIASLCTIEPL